MLDRFKDEEAKTRERKNTRGGLLLWEVAADVVY